MSNTNNNQENQSNASQTSHPEWDWYYQPHADLVGGGESLIGYLFVIEKLEAAHGIYSTPVFVALLKGLGALRQQQAAWRDSSFTVFVGDCGSRGDMFYLGFSADHNCTIDGAKIRFLGQFFEDVPGFYCFETGSSAQFLPVFRYDHGHIIHYGDQGREGTCQVDRDYGSSLTLHYRLALPPELAGLPRHRSRYGRLVGSW